MRLQIYALLAALLVLTGCQTMDSAWNNVGNMFSGDKTPDAAEVEPLTPEPAVQTTMSRNGTIQPCPGVVIVKELREMQQYIPTGSTPEDKISDIAIKNISGQCTFNNTNIVMELDFTFEGALGPKARGQASDRPSFSYPYFVAITSPAGNILSKEIFTITMSYEHGENHLMRTDTMRQIIPLTDNELEQAHELLIGFQLTEEELSFNRVQTPNDQL